MHHYPFLVITMAHLSSAKPAAINFGSGGISFGGSSFGNLGESSFGNLGGSSFGSPGGLSLGNLGSSGSLGRQMDILNKQRSNLDWNMPINVDSTGFHQDAQNSFNRVANNLDWMSPITVDSTGFHQDAQDRFDDLSKDFVKTHSGGSQGSRVVGNSGPSYSNSGTSYSDSGNSGSSYSDNSGPPFSEFGNSGSSYSASDNFGISNSNSGTSYTDCILRAAGDINEITKCDVNKLNKQAQSGTRRSGTSEESRPEFDWGTGEHGSGGGDYENEIGRCPNFTPGDNAGEGEWFLQEHEMVEPTCAQSCKVNFPRSNGITESTVQTYRDGRFKCWCEFGTAKLNQYGSGSYRTCLFNN